MVWYGLVGMAWHMVRPGRHNMVQGMVWWGTARYMAQPGNAWQVYVMAWRAWYTVWHCGHGMECYMVRSGRYTMVYGMAWRASHGIWHGLTGIALYMVRPGRHGGHRMVYGMAWRGLSWYVAGRVLYAFRHCHGLQSHSHMERPMSGWGLRYRTCSQVEGLLHACSNHMYSSCSLWTGIVDREIVNL